MLASAKMSVVALVVAASGGIARALLDHYLDDLAFEQVIAVSRSQQPAELLRPCLVCDYTQVSIDAALLTEIT